MDLTVPVPKGTRGKDVVIVIKKRFLSVKLKGQEPILEGELCNDIKVDESTWTIGALYARLLYNTALSPANSTGCML